jgi:predicted nucleic acid-binding Zn ribbon protein
MFLTTLVVVAAAETGMATLWNVSNKSKCGRIVGRKKRRKKCFLTTLVVVVAAALLLLLLLHCILQLR